MKCIEKDCLNKAFKALDKCALHCEKLNYQNDRRSGLLEEFFRLLQNYLYQILMSQPSVINQGIPKLIMHVDDSTEENSDFINHMLGDKEVVIDGIAFPERNNRDSFDYFKLLNVFKGVHFIRCTIWNSDMNLKNSKVYFDECIFKNWFEISEYELLESVGDSVFDGCHFNGRLLGGAGENKPRDINVKLFKNCTFDKDIEFSDLNFKDRVFNNHDDFISTIDSISLENCQFDEDLKINNLSSDRFKAYKCLFKQKFELKQAYIINFELNDSNIGKIFDTFGSRFYKAYFYKSIFKDFAGFEGVIFGDGNINNKTIFRYTTFKDFSNFRNSKFLSGLDLSNINLSQEPNFLNARVHITGTDRETFRIIKHSFDSVGNKIEANRFFVQEMKAYKKEIYDNNLEDVSFWDKLVYYMNDLISSFGQSYIKPTVILFISLILYTLLIYLHAFYFETRDYLINTTNSEINQCIDRFFIFLNDVAGSLLPFSRFLDNKSGLEFVSLIFYIWFAVLIWQIVIAVKRHTKR